MAKHLPAEAVASALDETLRAVLVGRVMLSCTVVLQRRSVLVLDLSLLISAYSPGQPKPKNVLVKVASVDPPGAEAVVAWARPRQRQGFIVLVSSSEAEPGATTTLAERAATLMELCKGGRTEEVTVHASAPTADAGEVRAGRISVSLRAVLPDGLTVVETLEVRATTAGDHAAVHGSVVTRSEQLARSLGVPCVVKP